VRIDGQVVESKPFSPMGQIRFQAAAGEHRVEASWARTSSIWMGDGISLTALAALVAVWRWRLTR